MTTPLYEMRDVVPFTEWYEATARNDATMVWEKARQYGGFDYLARALAEITGGRLVMVGSRLDLERAVALNAAQKMARIAASLGQEALPGLDSWRDLACYAMIARRIREVGAWPA